MVKISPTLIDKHLGSPLLQKMYLLLENDPLTQTYLKMANVMSVDRLNYNDHGPVHSRIASGCSLEIFELLKKKVTPTTMGSGQYEMDDARMISMCGAYLHDIGNSIHRVSHNMHACILAEPILDRLLRKVYRNFVKTIRIKQEILHCIFSHNEEVECLTMEAGCAKVADGTDMAEGRARMPYDKGKVDIHSLSALAIKDVEIIEGNKKPVRVVVAMDNPAGIFQIEQMLVKKIETSGIKRYIEIVAVEKGRQIKTL
jgi:metal-dependent HD superfamily phosphatase/phosphodiesterase